MRQQFVRTDRECQPGRPVMPVELSQQNIFTACSTEAYARKLAQQSPFPSLQALLSTAREIWWTQVPVQGWLEAFAAHPRIGDVDNLRQRFGSFADHSRSEQGASGATEQQIQELAHWNREYEARFGHIFIICATGKPALVMLESIKRRYHNAPSEELQTAAAEQMKITELRLRKLVEQHSSEGPSDLAARRAGQLRGHLEASPRQQRRSPITTHMLDTCLGKPAQGVPVQLQRLCPGSTSVWEMLSSSTTNADGRVPDLLPPADEVAAGTYRLCFETSKHMQRCKADHPNFFPESPFFPSAQIAFEIPSGQTRQHFHVPLTWNPYGYSTYRGS